MMTFLMAFILQCLYIDHQLIVQSTQNPLMTKLQCNNAIPFNISSFDVCMLSFISFLLIIIFALLLK